MRGEEVKMLEYQSFLESKRIVVPASGITVPESSINDALFPFQRDIVKWALRKGRAAVFAGTGLGKTAIQLEWAKQIGDVLILAPLAVSKQTVREGDKFGIEVNICRHQADVKPGVNITNYEKLQHFNPEAFAGIVLDESSILKAFSGKYRQEITQFASHINFRLACTATPAPNDLIEIINHAEFLGVMQGKEIIALFFTQDGNTTHACADFEMLTGVPAVEMDLFSRQQYIDFHGHEPPADWHEVTPDDLLDATRGEPDVVFLSPPCKGFSGLLPSQKAASEKYQALNRLVLRSMELTLEAFRDDLPAIIMIENVPRITSRGEFLLRQVKRILGRHGYIFHEGYHDCGELGGLGQRRKRYLLIARLPERVSQFIYLPRKQQVKSIGEVIGPLPMPDDLCMGPMHRLPRLQWKTWVRLALIPAGGDWRDLENLGHNPRDGAWAVVPWNETGGTVTGSARVGGSNGMTAVADPRTGFAEGTHRAIYRVSAWDEPGPTATGAMRPNNGAISVADPRVKSRPRAGSYGVQAWDEPAKTVIGAGDIHAGTAAVADPRVPADNDRPDPPPVIIALDGTCHRPLTTLELAALQGFPVVMPDGRPLQLAGKSDARWRERIGNAVPPPAAKAFGRVILRALLLSQVDGWELAETGIWVKPWEWESVKEWEGNWIG